jgi:transcriptional regulator with XRE-family HTH domain
MILNEKLRQARIDRRWSIDYAARRIGIGRTTYMRWEQGTQIPHDSSLMLACKAFNLSPEQLGFEYGPSDIAISLSEEKIKEDPANSLSTQKHPEWSTDPLTFSRDGTQDIIEAETGNQPEDSYDALEVKIIVMALRWKPLADSLAVLQQSIFEIIRKYDAMHEDHQNNYEARITRRHALQAIALFPIQMYGLNRIPLKIRALPLDETLASCASGIVACWELRQYEPEGLAAIQKILAAYLPILEQVARQSSPFQKAAANLAAQGYLLMGILANHYSKLEQMETTSRLARFYSQLAQDPNLEVSALIRLAIKFDFEDRDGQTLETYQEAAALPAFSTVSPLLKGRVYIGLAGMHAYCQKPSTALSYLSRARDIFPVDPQADPGYAFAMCDANSFALWEGLTLQYTNHYEEATAAFFRFGSLTPVAGLLETHRAENLNYATSLAIEQHDLSAACTYLSAAEDIAWNIQHEHLQAEVRDTLKSMRLIWPHEPAVKALQEKIYSRQY